MNTFSKAKDFTAALCLFSSICSAPLLMGLNSSDHDQNDYSSLHGKTQIYASFRNDDLQRIKIPGNVKFNIVDSNKGRGIQYDEETGEFLITRTGTYSLEYGVAGDTQLVNQSDQSKNKFIPAGFYLTVIDSCGLESVKDAFYSNASSSIVLPLLEGDRVKIAVQPGINEQFDELFIRTITRSPFGLISSNYVTDTSYITFIRVP